MTVPEAASCVVQGKDGSNVLSSEDNSAFIRRRLRIVIRGVILL